MEPTVARCSAAHLHRQKHFQMSRLRRCAACQGRAVGRNLGSVMCTTPRFGRIPFVAGSLLVLLVLTPGRTRADEGLPAAGLFSRTNLVAWCVVPFDARKRGPEERAVMLSRLGIRRLAYDWREEHISTFDAEVAACRRHGIELTAWWFPSTLDEHARLILQVLERNKVRTQLWVTGGGGSTASEEEQRTRVLQEADRIRPIAEAAERIGCSVGLYNHGGWFGEPENQVAIIRELGLNNVGIVYNFHHGHHQIDAFAHLFRIMQPHLLAVNLNGMLRDGDQQGRKILPIGDGDQERAMLRVMRDSGWLGPVGILDHLVDTDSEDTLRQNLLGLERLVPQLDDGR
jgi:sugar phosphate isomerase/epimerase